MSKKYNIAVIGLGYVGLPLAIELGHKFKTIGYDISKKKINSLNKNIDLNNEITKKQILSSKFLKFTFIASDIKETNIKIIAVPTPINKSKKPDLNLLKKASKVVALHLNKGDLIIYESTVYPGVTETVCVNAIEKYSKLKWKKDFNIGYSPERINPGDKKHYLTNINKLISADNRKSLHIMKKIYKSIINAKIYECETIKIAEAAKVIENTQRDINIAFINELKIIFDRLDIDTNKVLQAAKTKWNFIDFKPGLVGGHCIGVDPYYLSHISKQNNYLPKLILSGRKLNDNMSTYFAKKALRFLKKNNKVNLNSKVLILGFTFKENCSDIRNTKVIDIYNFLVNKKIFTEVYDPNINKKNANKIYKCQFVKKPKIKFYDLIILAVSHKQFISMGKKGINKFMKGKYNLFDIKNIL